jgi:hypothetical protein
MGHRFGILLLFVICGVGCRNTATPTSASGPPATLSLANFEKIQAGMTLREVEAILGPPGASVTSDVKGLDGSVSKDVQSASWFWVRSVVSPDGKQRDEGKRSIVVNLKDGKVTSKEQVGLE